MDYPDGGEVWTQPTASADVPPASAEQSVDPDTDPRVAAVVYLLHRRRGWAWTLGASVVALVVFVAIGTVLWPGGTGPVSVISGFTVILLLALAVVALAAVITDTVRVRRRGPSVRAQAASRTSHYPVAAHPFRTPVRHRPSHVVGWVALATFPLLTVVVLPDQVNAVAYLAGAGKTAIFQPQLHVTVCGRLGCEIWTDGVLETNPPVSTTWPNQVPLGQPFRVRQPWWNGWGHPVLVNAGAAAGAIAGVMFGELGSVFFAVGVVRMLRRRLRLP
jgi:uncharacterized membrane protein